MARQVGQSFFSGGGQTSPPRRICLEQPAVCLEVPRLSNAPQRDASTLSSSSPGSDLVASSGEHLGQRRPGKVTDPRDSSSFTSDTPSQRSPFGASQLWHSISIPHCTADELGSSIDRLGQASYMQSKPLMTLTPRAKALSLLSNPRARERCCSTAMCSSMPQNPQKLMGGVGSERPRRGPRQTIGGSASEQDEAQTSSCNPFARAVHPLGAQGRGPCTLHRLAPVLATMVPDFSGQCPRTRCVDASLKHHDFVQQCSRSLDQ